MNAQNIDEAIDNYVHERMSQGKARAREHLLAYAYLKNGSDEVIEFMKKVGSLSRYYIDYLKVMHNPFKGPEFAWLITMLTVASYACILMFDDDQRLLGICLFAGTVVHGGGLIVALIRKWCETGVMIAIYREIVQLVESELRGDA